MNFKGEVKKTSTLFKSEMKKSKRDYYNIFVWIFFILLLFIYKGIGMVSNRPDWFSISIIIVTILIHFYFMTELQLHIVKNEKLKHGIFGGILAIAAVFFALYIFPVYWVIYIRKEKETNKSP